MQVLRRLFIFLAWLFFGGLGFLGLYEGGIQDEVAWRLIGIAVILTIAFNWVFADKERDDE